VQHFIAARCSAYRQLIGPADWVFVTLGHYAVLSLEAVAFVYTVTQWSGSGGTKVYISSQLASFSALTLLVRSCGS